MTAYDRYRALLRKLVLVRARHPEGGSPEEDSLLDVMDEVWAEMTEGERSCISSERSRALGLPDSQDTDSAPSTQG
ncbi:hypothetical protein HPC49_42645 [Pyxidicoccus fallax]|uniref:Uncharacterized protein n=1 Tax=Pyxidicoccus fallax TaxID=394095 RepID=A0A848LV08_9BACT|nr:hypothetical protein [Pyxidicoccus fallax]NMO21402.1 hypothetical protein [Pyxidicoccus fallax]NPC84905.1 hypothetical protein [Pyxidicoccus fallax]